MEENTTYLLDDFVNVKAGEPFRLFPFGKLVKNGKVREITPEMAKLFKLPHFKPAIKLGSHNDTTPAGGHIVGLEVRSDGLYALPELNERGAEALHQGAYRYHSPEVIWDDGGLEDPTTGNTMSGPLIVGDALLHMPHLGEAAALYSISPIQEVKSMSETVEVPTSLWNKVEAFFSRLLEREEKLPEAEPEVEPATEPDQFEVVIAERDEYKSKLEALESERAKAARVEQFAAQLADVKIDGAEMLASMTDEQADWVLQQFKALSAQVDETKITGEIGGDGDPLPEQPRLKLDAMAKARAAEKQIDYVSAVRELALEQPDLFN